MNPIVNEKLPQILDKLNQFAIKLTRNKDKAEELVSDTIVKILEKQDLYKHDLYFSTWCTNIMKNLFIDKHRKESKGCYIEYRDDIEDVVGENNEGELKMNLEEIYDCINLLKEHEKQLVLRRLEDKMSFKELGVVYKLEPNTIRFKYYIVIKKLRGIIIARNRESSGLKDQE